jgi:hypothetical protein
MFTTKSDMIKMGQSILSSQLLSPEVTRQWMKPGARTSRLLTTVGKPWEIWTAPVELTGHLLDIYTKSGDAPYYTSMLAFIPDYDIGFVVLAAGGDSTALDMSYLADMVAEMILPALEETARLQAVNDIAGTYTSTAPGLNSSITLTTQSGQPGLIFSNWLSNASDVLGVLESLEGSPVDIRLYPSNLEHRNASGLRSVSYRAVIQLTEQSPAGGVFNENCLTWTSVDGLQYGSVGLDEFIIDFDGDQAVAVSPYALRTRLERAIGAGNATSVGDYVARGVGQD